MRAIRPPIRAEVRLERGRPAHLRSAVSSGRRRDGGGPLANDRTLVVGIRHTSPSITTTSRWRDGTVLRLCFDWKTKRWQVDGLYD